MQNNKELVQLPCFSVFISHCTLNIKNSSFFVFFVSFVADIVLPVILVTGNG